MFTISVNSTPLHYRADLSNNAVQLQQVPTSLSTTIATPPPLQQLSTHNSTPDPSYHIEDLSNSTHNSIATTQSTIRTTPPHRNPATSNMNSIPLTSVSSKKKGPPRTRVKRDTHPQPMVQIVEPQVQYQRPKEYAPTFTKCCQTEPLFDETWKPDCTRAEPSSLPSGLAFIETSDENSKICGVISTEDLEEGGEFGPYTGEFVREGLGCYNPSTWEVSLRFSSIFLSNHL